MSVSAKEQKKDDDANVTIDVLEKKLRGKPTALGRFAVPLAVVMFFWKSALAIAGLCVLPHVFALVRYEQVSIPWARTAVLWYVLLQIPDEAKNIIQRDSWDYHAHHLVTGFGFLLDYFVGSDRSLALCVFIFIGEIVAPAYQITHALQHLELGCSRLNLYALRAGWWLTVLFRIPIAVYIYPITICDIYYYFIHDETTLSVYGELQVWARVPALIGGLLLLALDQIWLRQIARMIRGVERVLAAKEKQKTN